MDQVKVQDAWRIPDSQIFLTLEGRWKARLLYGLVLFRAPCYQSRMMRAMCSRESINEAAVFEDLMEQINNVNCTWRKMAKALDGERIYKDMNYDEKMNRLPEPFDDFVTHAFAVAVHIYGMGPHPSDEFSCIIWNVRKPDGVISHTASIGSVMGGYYTLFMGPLVPTEEEAFSYLKKNMDAAGRLYERLFDEACGMFVSKRPPDCRIRMDNYGSYRMVEAGS